MLQQLNRELVSRKKVGLTCLKIYITIKKDPENGDSGRQGNKQFLTTSSKPAELSRRL